MLLIVAHHYVVNSGVIDIMYEFPLSANSIFLFLFGAWGKTGINCFILITGYFMCRSRITLEKFAKLVLEVLFYNLILSFLFILTGYGSLKDFVYAFVIVRHINSGNFTSCFLIFYLLIPFLNIFLERINKRQHQILLVILLFLYVFLGTVPTFGVVMNYVSWFCVLYFVAAYIRFYPCDKREWRLYLAVLVLVAYSSIIICLTIGNLYDKQMAYRFVSDSNTFIAFAVSVCSFMVFKNLRLKHSSFINAIGGSTFGVLCIHANSNAMRKMVMASCV